MSESEKSLPSAPHAELSLSAKVIQTITGSGDLGQLSENERAQYLISLCESVGLNPLSRPIELMTFQGRMVPYAKKDCTDQLRKRHGVSIEIVSKEHSDGYYIVTARAKDDSGRADEDIGAVFIGGNKGEGFANAIMKAHTKAKRRVTLSFCGLGILDESEVEDMASSSQTIGEKLIGAGVSAIAPEQRALPAKQEPAEDWAALIAATKTSAETRSVGARMSKALQAGTPHRKAMSAVYKTRLAEQEAEEAKELKAACEVCGLLGSHAADCADGPNDGAEPPPVAA